MKNWKSRLPALILAVTLLAATPPALSGGRDVPDHIAEGTSETYAPPTDWNCSGSSVIRVSVGWLSFDIVTAPDGTVSAQPSLVREASQILRRVLEPGEGQSCPTE